MKNYFKILIGLLICALASLVVFASDLTITADKQSFKMEENKAKFDGNVQILFEDITVKGPRAEVNIDPKTQKLTDATIFDKPYVIEVKKGKTNEVKANILKMSLITKTIRAEGNTQTTVTEDFQKKPTVVITADTQEYDTNSKVLTATGNVIINYKDAQTYSNKAVAYLNKAGDLQKIVLLGNGRIKQEDSVVTANEFVYDVIRDEAFAIGNAHSNVLMNGSRINVWSARQEFNNKTGILMASGAVHVIYKDYDARGPKATVYPDPKTKKLNEIVFIGRSKIQQINRIIEADSIKMYLEPKNFYADGNVKTTIKNVQREKGKNAL